MKNGEAIWRSITLPSSLTAAKRGLEYACDSFSQDYLRIFCRSRADLITKFEVDGQAAAKTT